MIVIFLGRNVIKVLTHVIPTLVEIRESKIYFMIVPSLHWFFGHLYSLSSIDGRPTKLKPYLRSTNRDCIKTKLLNTHIQCTYPSMF